MSVTRQPDGKWSVDFYVDGRGSQRIRRAGFLSKAHAQRFERDYIASPRPSVERLGDLFHLWYQVHGLTLKRGSVRYAGLQRIADRLGNPRACDFTSAMWSTYRINRLKVFAKSTVNLEHTYVSSVFSELIRQGHYQGLNPLAGMRLFRTDQKSLAFLTLDQIQRLLAELAKSTNPYVLIITKICLATGCRWSEAEGLRRSQVLSDRIVFTGTKSGRNRTVPVDLALIHEVLSVGLPSDRLFSSSRGSFGSCYACCDFNTPGQLTHILRHTFASHFIMSGGDLRTLKDILGHADISTTMIYSHLAPEHLHKAVTLNPLALSSLSSHTVDNV